MKNKKKIPERMLAIAGMVDKSDTLADIGCDHAYISINLIENGKVEKIIASDLRKGPLKIAGENIRVAGLEDRIETRLCSGLEGFKPGEADTILISGMGGLLVKEILFKGKEVVDKADTLILEPQSDLRLVRAYLDEARFQIIDEDMLCEAGKYYQIMKAVRREEERKQDNSIQTMAENEFGPVLIKKKHPVLKEFLLKRKKHFEDLLQNKKFIESQTASENERISIIDTELKMVIEVLRRFETEEEVSDENRS